MVSAWDIHSEYSNVVGIFTNTTSLGHPNDHIDRIRNVLIADYNFWLDTSSWVGMLSLSQLSQMWATTRLSIDMCFSNYPCSELTQPELLLIAAL